MQSSKYFHFSLFQFPLPHLEIPLSLNCISLTALQLVSMAQGLPTKVYSLRCLLSTLSKTHTCSCHSLVSNPPADAQYPRNKVHLLAHGWECCTSCGSCYHSDILLITSPLLCSDNLSCLQRLTCTTLPLTCSSYKPFPWNILPIDRAGQG